MSLCSSVFLWMIPGLLGLMLAILWNADSLAQQARAPGAECRSTSNSFCVLFTILASLLAMMRALC
jgi:hypothetical protein